jgi:hypothetical protein
MICPATVIVFTLKVLLNVTAWLTVREPLMVVACPVRPIETAAAVVVPSFTVGVPDVYVPVSIVMSPEAPDEALPVRMVTPLLVVPAAVWILPLASWMSTVLEPDCVSAIAAPEPAFWMARTAPEADAYCWFRVNTFDESAHDPAVTVQLLEKFATEPFMVRPAALSATAAIAQLFGFTHDHEVVVAAALYPTAPVVYEVFIKEATLVSPLAGVGATLPPPDPLLEVLTVDIIKSLEPVGIALTLPDAA